MRRAELRVIILLASTAGTREASVEENKRYFKIKRNICVRYDGRLSCSSRIEERIVAFTSTAKSLVAHGSVILKYATTFPVFLPLTAWLSSLRP
jgi:hypothetical protein